MKTKIEIELELSELNYRTQQEKGNINDQLHSLSMAKLYLKDNYYKEVRSIEGKMDALNQEMREIHRRFWAKKTELVRQLADYERMYGVMEED